MSDDEIPPAVAPDQMPADDRLAPTMSAFYVQNQRMPEKSDAMAAWFDALVTAYEKAGGNMPEPKETNRRPSWMKKAPSVRAEAAE
jgi:hypothetical protein